jgi:hypothetical protein
MKRIGGWLAILAVVVACHDQRLVTSPSLDADFLDGRSTNGNHHFFFLPPLVSQPTFSGTFNPDLRPIVLICQLDVVVTTTGTTPTGCSAALQPIDPGPVQVDPLDEQYLVNWNTGQPAIDPTKFYRIQVFGSRGGTLLGFADVDPVSNGSQLRNVQTDQFIGLVDGRTLPIKFRIERGAFCKSTTDCGEATIGPGGGTVITNTGLAGALFPPGALPADVVVTIETVTERPCLPIDLLQRSGCYEFTTDPGPTVFGQQVTAGVCVDVEGLTPTEISLLHLHQLDFVDEAPVVTPLPNVAAHFLTCDAPHPPPTSVGLARKVMSLFLPKPLFAAHLGVGGLTGSFSRIGWALPAHMSIKAGDAQTADAGATVAIPPSVLLKDSSGAPVPAESVKFSVVSGGGTVTGGASSTDATGVAAVTSWTLGPASGRNTLIATSRGAVGSPVTFTATVCGSLEAPSVTSGWTLSTQAVNVSTVSGGEALVLNPLSGAIFVKSLQDPAGFSVQVAQVNPDGSVTTLTTLPSVQNSDLSGIALDPLTGGIIVADAISPGVDGRIALIGLPDLTTSTLFQVNWVMNPGSNGTGQQQYATDPANPNILYFWDATLSKLFRLDRPTGGLQEVLALDQATAAGQHFSTFHNDIVFDQPTGKLLLTDGGSNSVLEVDPSTSPATARTLFSGLSARPAGIAVNSSTNQVFVVVGFHSILVGPRAGGSLSLVACGFPLLADIAVNGSALYAVDKGLNTLYRITPSVVP